MVAVVDPLVRLRAVLAARVAEPTAWSELSGLAPIREILDSPAVTLRAVQAARAGQAMTERREQPMLAVLALLLGQVEAMPVVLLARRAELLAARPRIVVLAAGAVVVAAVVMVVAVVKPLFLVAVAVVAAVAVQAWPRVRIQF